MTLDIFIDTEFVSFQTPKLISIGLVIDGNCEFYVENTDPKIIQLADTFVKDTILPQFGIIPQSVCSIIELGKSVGDWLISLNSEKINIYYDYSTDMTLLEQALRKSNQWETLKGILNPMHIGYIFGSDCIEEPMDQSWNESFKKDGIDRHHALADARALKAGFSSINKIKDA